MVYRGQVRGGVVILDGGVELPEGTAVTVEAAVAARGVPRVRPLAVTPADDAEEMEMVDRLLGSLRFTSDEAMEAQRRIDRVL